MSTWAQLLANFAVVAMFVSAWIQTHVWADRLGPRTSSAAFGLLMGVGVVALMNIPVQLMPGVNVDLRFAMVGLSGLFGGPIACLITGVMAGAFRLYEGGMGAYAGTVAIGAAMIIAIAGHTFLRGRSPSRRDIVLVAAAVAVGSRIGLAVLPWDVVQAYMKSAAAPSALLDFASIVLVGLALYQERRRVEALHSKRIYKQVVDALPDCLNIKDLNGKFIAANPATAQLMRATDEKALIGKSDFDFYPKHAAQKFHEDEQAVLRSGKSVTIDQQFTHGDGVPIWLSTLKTPLTDYKGRIIGLITHNRDITERKELENQLAASRIQLTDALAHMADGLVMYDKSGRMLLCNEQYRAMFPRTEDIRVPGSMHRDILQTAIDRGEIVVEGEVETWIDNVIASQGTAGSREIQTGDGRWLDVRTRPTDDGGRLSVFTDITVAKQAAAELMAANAKLDDLAHRDGLTDLSTRRAFDESLEREVGRSRRAKTPLSLLLIDVDWFKRYNDAYGHPAGDECLRAVARCIQATARRPTDLAARYGGEEFAVILPETDARGAFVIAETLKAAVRDLQLEHNGSEKKVVTVSIGVATFEGTGELEIAKLLRRADEALYGAKAAGRDRVHGWRPHAENAVPLKAVKTNI